MNDKYSVRKKDGTSLAPGTFFVLRNSDKFAYAALWQYSQVLQVAREFGHFSDEEDKRILDLQLLVEALAQSWQAGPRKVPD